MSDYKRYPSTSYVTERDRGPTKAEMYIKLGLDPIGSISNVIH